VVGAAAVAVAGAVAVPVALRSGGSAPAPSGNGPLGTATSPSPSPLPLLDVAYVKTQTLKALAEASNSIVQTHDTYGDGGYHDAYRDATTGRSRLDAFAADGSPAYSLANTFRGDPKRSIQVDFGPRTYSVIPTVPPPTRSLPPGDVPPSDDPAVLQAALTAGDLRLVGPESVEGHDTLHVTLARPTTYGLELWVDVTTFRPFKAELFKGSGAPGAVAADGSRQGAPPASPFVPTATATETLHWSWLERTPENLAHFDLEPPAGFTRH
jgi:hypothetical protein